MSSLNAALGVIALLLALYLVAALLWPELF